ncbi:hypothetical protein TEA_008916 [Camellia sinensis var. sinensis]|uniref:ABC transporter domain-containing protein n=1 Tax=Camellia sinensis var. sinensis TaxID=542762 RepID=A0A4S4EV49_CAMSN|nr:hypothetical protein TEA_008916 [Camellia sinensis var. sinensis]
MASPFQLYGILSKAFFLFCPPADIVWVKDLVKLPGMKSQEARITIVDDISGIIKPGRMTLLLGPPGCGKTTLLKALSGNLNKSLKVAGEVSYNGYKLEEFIPQKTSAYISQNDLHIPEMTVRETLDFSARCQGVGSRADIMIEVSEREKQAGIVPDPDIDTYMKTVKKGDTIFVGQYLFTGIETTSVWLEVLEIRGPDIICLVKNSASLVGFVFTMHVSQVHIDLPTLTDVDRQAISVEGQKTTLQTDYIIKILGLDICADTLAGDAMRRGISGGQKKRLTTGEMIVGPTKALFMDEISNGLDSSTTYQIVACLQQVAHIADATILVALLQPAPETFDLFDEIILMTEGKIVYHGPRSHILEFFEDCGFRCPERKGVADFLQEVMSKKDQAQYWHQAEQPCNYISADMFSKKFKESNFGKKLDDELSKQFMKPQSHKNAISFSIYSLSKWALFRACISRELLLMRRNSFIYLILLKSGGQIIYSGPLGQHSSSVIEYFEDISGVPKIKNNYNPATWMLDVTSTSAEAELGVDFAQVYKNSVLYQNNRELVNRWSTPPPDSKELYFATRFAQNGWGQFKCCLWKQHPSYWRSPAYNLQRFVYMIVASFLFGVLFWDQGKKLKNQQSLFNVFGSMFSSTIFLGINNCSSILPYISTERSVLFRERFAGMYGSWAYALAQVTIEIPYLLAISIAFVVITYPMIGYYWSAYKVFWYFYAMFCTLLYFSYLGMLLIAMTPSFPVAAILQSAFYTIFNLFAGFLIPQPQIPKWWIWLYYINPTAWTLNGMLTSQYGDIDQNIKVFGETKTVAAFLRDYFGYRHDQLPIVAVMLLIFPIVFASLFAFCIGKLNFQRR